MPDSLRITPVDLAGSHLSLRLHSLTKEQIESVLGFAPNVQDDGDKVTASWGFKPETPFYSWTCGIWDYKGSAEYGGWSFYGELWIADFLFHGHT